MIIRVSDGCAFCGCDGCRGCSGHPWRECTCAEYKYHSTDTVRLKLYSELSGVRLTVEIPDDQT